MYNATKTFFVEPCEVCDTYCWLVVHQSGVSKYQNKRNRKKKCNKIIHKEAKLQRHVFTHIAGAGVRHHSDAAMTET